MSTIGIFGGTFDPIHLGHLHLATEIRERKELDEVWFCPAAQSPHKGVCSTSADDRREMIDLAISANPAFKLLNWELQREGPSYTINTLRQLKEEYPETDFALIIADELVPSLPKWREIYEILQLATLYVGQRIYTEPPPKTEDPLIDEAVSKGYIPMPLVKVKATTIRDRLRKGLDCTPYLASEVLAYISAHNLY